jgi:4-hydroxysphinganine ceramide fatty acyl 2-hydroxylase
VVNSPHWFFVPSPKLFESAIFELTSISTWWHVAILPLLVIGIMFWKVEDWSNFHILTSLLVACLGAFVFTLIEYILHRFIFHADWYLPDVRVLRMLHFFLHGIHHMLPNDP